VDPGAAAISPRELDRRHRSAPVSDDVDATRRARPAGRSWPPPGAIVRAATDAELVEALERVQGHRRALELGVMSDTGALAWLADHLADSGGIEAVP